MEVTVYGCRSDELLLVPSCLLPPIEAEHRLGPLSPRGSFRLCDGRADDWRWIADQIDRHSYAVVDPSRAVRLLLAAPAAQPHQNP